MRKCCDTNCCSAPQLPDNHGQWLPDPVLNDSGDHYLPLKDVINTETTDANRASLCPLFKSKDKATTAGPQVNYFLLDEEEKQKKDTSLFTTQNGRAIVNCEECSKPRVLYARQKLSRCQELNLTLALSELEYTCGSPLVSPDHQLWSLIQCRLSMSCGDVIELAYYASRLGRGDTCCFCAATGAEKDILKSFKTVLPCCIDCLANGRKPVVARPYGKQKQ